MATYLESLSPDSRRELFEFVNTRDASHEPIFNRRESVAQLSENGNEGTESEPDGREVYMLLSALQQQVRKYKRKYVSAKQKAADYKEKYNQLNDESSCQLSEYKDAITTLSSKNKEILKARDSLSDDLHKAKVKLSSISKRHSATNGYCCKLREQCAKLRELVLTTYRENEQLSKESQGRKSALDLLWKEIQTPELLELTEPPPDYVGNDAGEQQPKCHGPSSEVVRLQRELADVTDQLASVERDRMKLLEKDKSTLRAQVRAKRELEKDKRRCNELLRGSFRRLQWMASQFKTLKDQMDMREAYVSTIETKLVEQHMQITRLSGGTFDDATAAIMSGPTGSMPIPSSSPPGVLDSLQVDASDRRDRRDDSRVIDVPAPRPAAESSAGASRSGKQRKNAPRSAQDGLRSTTASTSGYTTPIRSAQRSAMHTPSRDAGIPPDPRLAFSPLVMQYINALVEGSHAENEWQRARENSSSGIDRAEDEASVASASLSATSGDVSNPPENAFAYKDDDFVVPHDADHGSRDASDPTRPVIADDESIDAFVKRLKQAAFN